MILPTDLERASTRQLTQPPVRGDWELPRYNRRPHRPTPTSRNFSERFSSVPHTKKFVSVWYPTHSLCVGNATRWPDYLVNRDD